MIIEIPIDRWRQMKSQNASLVSLVLKKQHLQRQVEELKCEWQKNKHLIPVIKSRDTTNLPHYLDKL